MTIMLSVPLRIFFPIAAENIFTIKKQQPFVYYEKGR